MSQTAYRTHHATEVTEELVGQKVTLSGWVDRRRDHGGVAFIDLRDNTGLVQVVINIVNNAIKYTPEGSHITLSAHREGDQVEVEIADDGPGIDQDAKDRIFDMFYTADKKRGDSRRGLGLGLSLCKSIINAHGGTIQAVDNHPQGTIFRFTLGAVEETNHE